MTDFDRLCSEFEKMDGATAKSFVAESAVRILPELAKLTRDGSNAVELFAQFIIASVVADGRLAEEEYAVLYPMLSRLFGDEIDYDSAKKAVAKAAGEIKDLKKIADEMVDVIGILDENLKDEIIMVCLFICAVDGKVSASEKRWIKQLIK